MPEDYKESDRTSITPDTIPTKLKITKSNIQEGNNVFIRPPRSKVREAIATLIGAAAAFTGVTGMAIESAHSCGGCNACMPPPIERRDKRDEEEDDENGDKPSKD